MPDLDLSAIRARLAGATGRTYWRSLEELADTEAFHAFLHREFPSQASEWTDPVGRRAFLKLMAASLALAGVGACTRQPAERIVPYVTPPEEVIPGRPLFFATAMPLGGIATGLLVENHMGRPTKIEGNPDHPASLGATDVFSQASILTLYDPDRSQTLTRVGEVRPWGEFVASMQLAVGAARAQQGAGFRLLTETVTSPSLADQIRTLLKDLPQARWHQYEPAGRDSARAGATLAFGQPVDTVYRLEHARVIVALDADFLSCHAGQLRYTRDFAAGRRIAGGQGHSSGRSTVINRLYAIESSPSTTGARADHRFPLAAREIEAFARALAATLGVPQPNASGESDSGAPAPSTSAPSTQHPRPGTQHPAPGLPAELLDRWIPAIARDLEAHRGSSAIIPGDQQTPAVHALAHVLNQALGNVGGTVIYIDPIEAEPVDHQASLADLVRDIDAGLVNTLIIVSGNPAFSAPADLRFHDRLAKVATRVHLSLYDDETSELCHWHVPEAHYLETWGDARAYDGTVSICQPLIAPLYGGKSAQELLAVFSARPERSSYNIVREFWDRAYSERHPAWGPMVDPEGKPFADSNSFWRRALHDGLIAGTALPPKVLGPPSSASRQPSAAGGALSPQSPTLSPQSPALSRQPSVRTPDSRLEIIFRPDPTIFDGRFANNGWLQELPKPLTKITWDNAALISPETAEQLGLQSEDLVELRYEGRSVEAPIWILPGHANDSVTVTLGYGRTRAGRVGTGRGFNAYALRTSAQPWFGSGLAVRKLGRRYPLAATQQHHSLAGRDIIRAGTIDEYRRDPTLAGKHEEVSKRLSLYPPHKYDGYAWGMAIDINACVGCNACVVACQAENNIPVVGKDQVMRGREMHWLRVDAYHAGPLDNPDTYFQPVPCMHCENAPCEVVCPVAATVHSAEGLNDMVYNRCVGTRYCSNNCPYKVRRFNFLLYSDFTTPSLKMLRNPDVTVRSRGVMEKCTYCVQRINAAKIDSERENRGIRDGEIVTACQAACPAEAIVFGNINDPNSRVAKLKAQERNYSLLAELNTQPRTTYLAAVRNPNADIEKTTEKKRD